MSKIVVVHYQRPKNPPPADLLRRSTPSNIFPSFKYVPCPPNSLPNKNVNKEVPPKQVWLTVPEIIRKYCSTESETTSQKPSEENQKSSKLSPRNQLGSEAETAQTDKDQNPSEASSPRNTQMDKDQKPSETSSPRNETEAETVQADKDQNPSETSSPRNAQMDKDQKPSETSSPRNETEAETVQTDKDQNPSEASSPRNESETKTTQILQKHLLQETDR